MASFKILSTSQTASNINTGEEATKRAKLNALVTPSVQSSIKSIFSDDVRAVLTAVYKFELHPPHPQHHAQDSDQSKNQKSEKKKKSNLELFKEELKMQQQMRGNSSSYRGKAGGGSPPSRANTSATTTSASTNQNTDIPVSDQSALLPKPLPPLLEDGSKDNGDPFTTNVYCGYLPSHFTEQTLCDLFGVFGPLGSVKIMWPRTPEEIARNRLTGFVSFMKREDAEESMKYFQKTMVDGADLRVGWGKVVPLPPKPFYVHPKHSGPIETGLPFNAQQRQQAGTLDINSAVVKVSCGMEAGFCLVSTRI